MQQSIENLTVFPFYLDHTQAVSGEFLGSLPVWNWTNFKAANLNSGNGWRRLTTYDTSITWENQSFAYGKAIAGDIVGPWIWADLQSAILGFKWARRTAKAINDMEYKDVVTGYYASCTDAIDACRTAFDAASWAPGNYVYNAQAILGKFTSLYYASAVRYRCSSIEVSGVPTFIPADTDVYFYATGNYDFDSLGVVSGEWKRLEQLGVASASTLQAAYPGGTSFPIDLCPIACPDPDYYHMTLGSATPYMPVFVLKWVFDIDS